MDLAPVSDPHRDSIPGATPAPPAGPPTQGPPSDDPLAPFVVGGWAVEPATGSLTGVDHAGRRHLEPKMVDLLLYLTRRPGRVVTKEDMLEAVWPDTAVGTHAFWRAIAGLRKALGDDRRRPRYIETVPRRGYRLIAPVRALPEALPDAPRRDRPAALSPSVAGGRSWFRLLIVALALAAIAAVTAALLGLAAAEPSPRDDHATDAAAPEGAVAGPDPALDPDLDPEAYRSYLAGRQRFARRSAADLEAARRAFEHAVDLEPGFADAWAGLASAHSLLPSYGAAPARDHYRIAHAAVGEALRLAPRSAPAHAARGFLRASRDWDFAGAEAAYRRALALEPGDVTARQWLAEVLTFRGRFDESLGEIEHAARLAPLSPIVRAVWGRLLHAAGRYEQADRRLREALTLDPTFRCLYVDLATVAERRGRRAEAAAWHLTWLRAVGGSAEAVERLERALDAGGLPAFWRWLDSDGASAASSAAARAALGDREGSLSALARAATERGEQLLHLSYLPAFDPLRRDPRFRALTGRAAPPRIAGGADAPALPRRLDRRPRLGALPATR